MQEGLYIAASGGMIQQRKLEVLANNLANVSTAGFKKDGLVFHEMLPPFRSDNNFETSRNTLLETRLGNRGVSYAALTDFATNYSQGGLTPSGNLLDLALEGDGFFAVQTEEGIRYTRKGNFHLDGNNNLVNPDNYPLLTRNNEVVSIPPNVGQITVDPQGTVTVGNETTSIQLGQLKLVRFEDKTQLVKEGSGLFRMARGTEPQNPPADLSVRQGFVESSNVNLVDEMTKMIQTVRMFESLQHLIQTIDSANEQSVNNVGRVV